MDTTKEVLDSQDRALLQEAQSDLLDALQMMVRSGENELSNLLFGQLGIVTWWLERAAGRMPDAQRASLRAGMRDIKRLLQGLSPTPPSAN